MVTVAILGTPDGRREQTLDGILVHSGTFRAHLIAIVTNFNWDFEGNWRTQRKPAQKDRTRVHFDYNLKIKYKARF